MADPNIAFQPDAFQNDAFQTTAAPTDRVIRFFIDPVTHQLRIDWHAH